MVAAIELLEDARPSARTAHRRSGDCVEAPQYKGDPSRIVREIRAAGPVAFDPERSAIMLIAGDKAGNWVH